MAKQKNNNQFGSKALVKLMKGMTKKELAECVCECFYVLSKMGVVTPKLEIDYAAIANRRLNK